MGRFTLRIDAAGKLDSNAPLVLGIAGRLLHKLPADTGLAGTVMHCDGGDVGERSGVPEIELLLDCHKSQESSGGIGGDNHRLQARIQPAPSFFRVYFVSAKLAQQVR
jgi:hypothetical protein